MQSMNDQFVKLKHQKNFPPNLDNSHNLVPKSVVVRNQEHWHTLIHVDSLELGFAPPQYVKKCEGLVFKGDNVDSGIQSINGHFRINKVANNERLDQVMSYLEGSPLQWFMWTEDRYAYNG